MELVLQELLQHPGWVLLVKSMQGAKKSYQKQALAPCSSMDKLIEKNVLSCRAEQLDFCINLPNTLVRTCAEDLADLRAELEREQEDEIPSN